eukprot:829853-Karenia_brevis.AAC.1
MERVDEQYWGAILKKFKLQLQDDQRLARSTEMGSKVFKDLVDWLELKAKIDLQQEASELRFAFLNHFFPTLI